MGRSSDRYVGPVMEYRITKVFRDIFDDESLQLRDSMTANDVATWDSLNHIKLILALEREFQTQFTLEDLQNMLCVGDLKRILQAKGVA